jgi:hypothetical protein
LEVVVEAVVCYPVNALSIHKTLANITIVREKKSQREVAGVVIV